MTFAWAELLDANYDAHREWRSYHGCSVRFGSSSPARGTSVCGPVRTRRRGASARRISRFSGRSRARFH